VKEILECDLKLEHIAHPDLKARSPTARRSATTLARAARGHPRVEEEHIDFLETQLELLGRVGLQNYQQSQMKVS